MITRNSKLYMRVDGIKKPKSGASQKKRSLTFLSRARILLMARRFNIGLFFMLLVAVNFKMCMPDVEMKCIPCMTGDTSTTSGKVTKVDVTSYGAKGYNDYKIYYTYRVEGKQYSGIAADSGKGLTYLENHAVVVNYAKKNHSCSCVENMECLAESGLFTIIFGSVLFLTGIIFMMSGMRGIRAVIRVLEHGEIVNATVTGVAEKKKSYPSTLNPFSRHESITNYAVTCSFTILSGSNRLCMCFARKKHTIKKDDTLTVIYDPDIPENSVVIEALPRHIKTKPELTA